MVGQVDLATTANTYRTCSWTRARSTAANSLDRCRRPCRPERSSLAHLQGRPKPGAPIHRSLGTEALSAVCGSRSRRDRVASRPERFLNQ
jgi:hypothetical protein